MPYLLVSAMVCGLVWDAHHREALPEGRGAQSPAVHRPLQRFLGGIDISHGKKQTKTDAHTHVRRPLRAEMSAHGPGADAPGHIASPRKRTVAAVWLRPRQALTIEPPSSLSPVLRAGVAVPPR